MLTVCSSSTQAQLTTVQSVKDVLGVTSTADDALLDTLVTRASRAVESYLGYPLLRQAYSERLQGFGDNRLMVSRTPLVSVDVILCGCSTVSPDLYAIEQPEAGTIWRDDGWQWTAGVVVQLTEMPMPGAERYDFTVDYSAGYVYPRASTYWDLPEDLEGGVIEVVKDAYKKRKTDSSIASKTVGDLSINYRSDGPDKLKVPPAAVALLEPYRRWR